MRPVVHFEIPIDEHDRAKTFYARVFDWQMLDMGYFAYFKDTEGNIMGLWEDMK